ncbi:PPOX class F420-dependent oxidoreductase [Antrihabitans cavernicola]|uniref:PPOX class F420-dependent oxidoreductase n=1 Tax=Antrihabitans cavernicola TaxID=2495913 RepID=A0A5A7SBK6_9NOCA|nr:PPOX class F420-dependent oxidoreductase [Spelaeibacter cavernicola]KAA0023306.1 PPOX class F420-dependent oxidoreductase [Spelaeibacter cavernicola]
MARGQQLITRVTAVQYRLLDTLRDKRAFDVAAQTPTGIDFDGFLRTRQVVLVTYKRSGEAVPSPINHGVADGKLYVRTDGNSFKVKRLRNNPHAVLVPSGFRGKPMGPSVRAIGRILPESECQTADDIVAANWSLGMRLFERSLEKTASRFDIPQAWIEFTPER